MSPTSRYLAEALASDQRAVTIVEIWTGPTALAQPMRIRDISDNVVVATWSEDETRSPRWTCSVTIESLGVGNDDLVPRVAGDLLHPVTGNELRIFHGYQYVDGTREVVPCGVYRMTKPHITDDGTKVEIVITGNDRSTEVDRRRWVNPYPITTGPTIDVAIRDAMNNRMPGLTYSLTPTTHTVPSVTFGTQGANSNGPMADCISMANADGEELFFDDAGVLTSRVVPDPMTSPVVVNFTEGVNCTMNHIERVLDETKTYNGVIATSSAAGVSAPVQQAVWITDPTSLLNPATFGYVPFFYDSPFITTSAQAISAATAILQTLLTAYDDASFTAVANAALRCGDVIGLTRTRAGVSDIYVVSQTGMSSDPKQAMTVTLRARKTAA